MLAMLIPCGRELGEANGVPCDEVEVIAFGPADLGAVGGIYQKESPGSSGCSCSGSAGAPSGLFSAFSFLIGFTSS